MPEDRCNPLQICGSIVHISGVQLHLKRTPRAVSELDDRVNLPTLSLFLYLLLSIFLLVAAYYNIFIGHQSTQLIVFRHFH